MSAGSSLAKARTRHHWLALKGLAVLFGIAVLCAGWGASLDGGLQLLRDKLRLHPASGSVAIVEIDGRSLAALNQWPWPRRYHAQLIDRLTDAGARSTAFDVAFSALSNAQDDAQLTAALERAGGSVILPTFRQEAGSGDTRQIEVLPLPAFAQHSFLAGVNVVPDADGYVRRIPLGTLTDGTPRPSLASLIAEAPGEIGRVLDIDFSIDPETIPRLSFVDVMEGRVPADQIAGRRIIVGGTAVDMGDRYAVPMHGVIPGVVIQAMAAETMLGGGIPATGSSLIPLMLAAAIIAFAVGQTRPRLRDAAFAWGTLAMVALPLATEHWFTLTYQIVPALSVIAFGFLGTIALRITDRLYSQRRVDIATGLPNLVVLREALPETAGAQVVVARIDRFSAISAGLGADLSARLVQRVAERLASHGADIVFRIDEGGLAWIETESDVAALETRLLTISVAMRAPIDCGRPVDVALTFGFAPVPSDGEAGQAVANAGLAVNRAQRENMPWAAHIAGTSEETGWHLSLLGELDTAIASGDVWNAYQPKVDIASGRIVGAEALVRWTHKERGPVGPDAFIPLVEASGRAADLTAHVLKTALRDLRGWQQRGREMGVAVNVSATLLDDQAFIARVEEIIQTAAVNPSGLTIEVTESATMKDPVEAALALQRWRGLDVRVSIDDYGTGQSSLAYLQTLPATELKLDKSFVADVAVNPKNAVLVRSTIAMAHQLGMRVVGEGVEDEACLAELRSLGCDLAQGWHCGKPMPADALARLLDGEWETRRKVAA